MSILGIDIGGSYLKAAVLDERGRMLSDKVKLKTPHPCPPKGMVRALVQLVEPLLRSMARSGAGETLRS